MKISFIHLSFITVLVVLLTGSNYITQIYGQCLGDQKASLIKFMNNLTFDSSLSTKLVKWDQNADCCLWPGVSCDEEGHVLVLELEEEAISGGIDNSSSLFNLQHLEKLNMANNTLDSVRIPTEIYKLKNLTYLDLSFAGFDGQIPIELSRLTHLVFLDLSSYNSDELSDELPFSHPFLELGSTDLKTLVGNLANLRELYLDGVNISSKGSEWCSAVSSSLPQLRVLSMRYSGISGPLDPILLNLHFLSVIRLDGNDLSHIPESVVNFTKLTTMSLRNCNLRGSFPSKLIHLPTLQELDLSHNENLTGPLPEFPQGSALREVVLSHTGFTGWLPDSIGNLSNLTRLALSSCNFSGPIPLTLGNLTDLVVLDLSSNSFSGSIPLFHKAKKLYSIDLSTNNLTGPLTSAHFGSLSDLVSLYLSENSITGTVPSVLLSLPSLQILYLRKNQFSGEVHEFDASFSVLEKIDLSSNHLNGSIPRSIFKLKRLSELLLSSNSFSGTIKIEVMKELPGLYWLDLSYNNLRIDVEGSNSTSFPFPQLSVIRLASCELQKFPDLTNQSSMLDLDLSLNNIKGQIPSWVWSVYYLNLSCNLLESLQNPYVSTTLQFMDLHSNMINGNLPTLPISLTYLSLANNKFTGSIPSSICNLDQLQFLDMSNNSLNNKIPTCLLQKTDLLVVLKLGRNKLSGVLPDTFALNCNLKTLDLSNYNLEGKVPTSLERCAFLEVFDIGNNKIRDTFPCMLKKISSLHVIVLRLNRFHGNLQCPIVNNQTWSKLQIVDLSSNNFSGDLLPQYFFNWKGMILSSNSMQGHQHLQVDFIVTFYYQNTVTLNLKGQLMEILNIVEAFTSIDFSCNNFQGEIPDVLGDLKSLYLLNFSHNALTGKIPKALGKLTQLESLDFSVNQLSGRIPEELGSLTFLAVLNLSFNQLSGRIPNGNQLRTFSSDSFEGNIGLCDFPLKNSCSETKVNGSSQPSSHSEHDEIDGKFIGFALGSSMGFGIVIWLLLHCRRYNELVDSFLFRILGPHKKSGRNKNRRRSR